MTNILCKDCLFFEVEIKKNCCQYPLMNYFNPVAQGYPNHNQQPPPRQGPPGQPHPGPHHVVPPGMMSSNSNRSSVSDQSYPPPLQRPLPPPNGNNHGGQGGGSQGPMPHPNQAYRVPHPASSHSNAPMMMRSQQQQPSRFVIVHSQITVKILLCTTTILLEGKFQTFGGINI